MLNDDDYLMHDVLESIITILSNNPEIFLFGAHSIHFSGSELLSRLDEKDNLIRTKYPDYLKIPLLKHFPVDIGNIVHSNDSNMTHSGSAFLKIAWLKVGGYYSNKHERVTIYTDRDFQMRVASLFPVAASLISAFFILAHG